MSIYESTSKTIHSSPQEVFNILSDLKNFENIRYRPEIEGKVRDFIMDTDSCSFVVEPIGKIGFKIVEKEPYKSIRYESAGAPLDVNVWINLHPENEEKTAIKLVLKADLPMMIKLMLDKKLKEGVDLVAETLAQMISK